MMRANKGKKRRESSFESQGVGLYLLRLHIIQNSTTTVERMMEERKQSKMVVAGSDLIAGHGGLQPIVEEADL